MVISRKVLINWFGAVSVVHFQDPAIHWKWFDDPLLRYTIVIKGFIITVTIIVRMLKATYMTIIMYSNSYSMCSKFKSGSKHMISRSYIVYLTVSTITTVLYYTI